MVRLPERALRKVPQAQQSGTRRDPGFLKEQFHTQAIIARKHILSKVAKIIFYLEYEVSSANPPDLMPLSIRTRMVGVMTPKKWICV